jgi:outer membrane protein assembly complex protein YaeT
LAALFVAGLHTPPARRFVLGRVASILRDQGVQFDASQLQYNLLTLRVDLQNVRIQSRQAPDLPPILTADRVQARFSLRKLLAGAYYVEDASIDKPLAHLVFAVDGRDNIPRLPASKPNSQPVDYLVRRLRITGGELRFDDQKQQVAAILPLDAITVDGDPITLIHGLTLRASSGGQLTFAGRSLPVRALNSDLLIEKDAAQIRSLAAQLGETALTLYGRIDHFDAPVVDLEGKLTAAIEPLSDFAGLPRRARGNVSLALTAKGPPADLRATVDAHAANLTFDQFDGLNLSARAIYESGRSLVRVESLALSSPSAKVRGQGDISLTTPGAPSTVHLSVEDVDLARVGPALGIPVRIASAAAATVDARWPGLLFEQASGSASVRVRARSQSLSQDALPLDATINAAGDSHRLVLRIDDLRALAASVTGEVTLTDRQSLAGELHIDAPRLSASLTDAEVFVGKPQGSLADANVEGALTSTATISGTLSAPAATATVVVPDLSAGDLRGIAVNAGVSYAQDRLSIDDASVSWQNQTVRAAGTIGLTAPLPLHLTARADAFSIATVLAGMNQPGLPISGDLAFTAEVNGVVDAPDASLHLTGRGLRAYQEELGALDLQAQLRGRELRVSGARLGPLTAFGAYNLDSRRYQLQANAQDWRLSQLTLPDGTPVRATVTIDAAGQGSLDDPAGNLKLVAENIQYGSRDLGRAELSARGANRRVELEALAPKFHLAATAQTATRDPYPATLQVRLTQSDLAALPVQLDPPLEGTVSATLDASGNLKDYQRADLKADVSSLDLTWNGLPIRAEGPVRARYTAGTLTVDPSVFVAAGSRVEVAGALPLDTSAPEGAVRLNARLQLSDIARFAPSGTNVAAQGAASIEGTLRGTLRRIDPALAISVEDASFTLPATGAAAVTGLSLRASLRDGALDLTSASAKWGTASFQASGVVPFALLPADLPVEIPRRQGPARLTADLKDLNLSTLPGVPAGLSGATSVHLEAEAPRPELEAVRASITLPEFRAALDTYALAQDSPSEITVENGVALIRHLRLTGPATEIDVSGTADLIRSRALDVRLDGKLDASLASSFSRDLRMRGATEVHALVAGTLDQPQAKGFLQIADGQLSIANPRVGVEGLNLRIDVDGSKATISRLNGQLNGGNLTGGGSAAYVNGKLQDAGLSLRAEDVYLDFPTGLKTVSDVRLQLRNVGETLALRGAVVVKEGGFTDDLNFDKGILAAVTGPRSLDLTTERNPLLDSLRFNVSVVTQDPIAIQNNLAKAEVTMQLVVLGSPYQPGLAGRLVIEEGSELTLQERRYEVTRGIITFTGDRRIEPNLDIEATTTASSYDITLRISGAPGETKTELTSNPALPEPDILAILVTGKTLDEIRGQEFQVAQTQVMSYLTGRVGSTLGRQVERATGLSRVRVEPNLIAAETNPGARLTVGQDITRQLQLVYSMDLVNSSDQIYIAQYDLTKRFVTRGVRQSDGSFRFDFHHDIRFGGIARPQRTRTDNRRIGNVAIQGELFFPEEKIRRLLKVKPGDRYDFFKVRRGLDRVDRFYWKENLLESNVHLRREQKASTVNLSLRIEPGPKLEFVFEGAAVPGHVEKEVRRVWSGGVFDTQRSDDAAGVMRAWLVGDRYFAAEVTPAITSPAPGRKRVLFDIRRGPRFDEPEWVFDGANGISAKRLRDVIESQKLSTDVYTKPERVSDLLTQFYREMGYLDAAISPPRYEFNPAEHSGRVIFPVREGTLYRVGEARFEGVTVLTPAELDQAAPLPRNETYRPALRENAVQRLREAYWTRGYNDVDVIADVQRLPERARVDLTFRVTENARGIVREITVEGNRHTSENLIRTQLDIKAGDPVNLQKIGNSRRKLYNTGAFAMVEIAREDAGTATGAQGSDIPIRLRVRVQEVQPFELSYGASYDSDHGIGGLFDFANRNTLGSARVVGLRGRYDAQLREARLYFSQPLLSRFPLKTVASPYLRREIHPETELASPFNVDRVGFSIQQEALLPRRLLVNLGYRIERSRTYDVGPDPIFDVSLRIASLTSTVTRDTRDELLDATRGSFLSHAFQFSPESLGSQVRFVKYFGQYFRYFPLQKPRVELFTNQVLRPRLIYATALRVGLATGLGGQEVPRSERFLAGGGTTIRGFEQDAVGPPTLAGIPPGGTGMLVLNNELRFPLFWIFDGAAFLDVGNVYAKVSDFSLGDLRKSAGPGLRVRTPWFLLRLDYGVKLDRRPGESFGRIFFSIGQAF